MLNPLHRWVDPRIGSVRPDEIRAYLLLRGWTQVVPKRPAQFAFREPLGSPDDPLVLTVPALEHLADYSQRILEAVTHLAEFEDRYAVDVLNDILNAVTPHSHNGNGTDSEHIPEVARN